jgi:translocation and assembly module TamB
MSRVWKILRYLLGCLAGLLIVLAAVIFVLQTDWFKNRLRMRIASIAETATGGRVDIPSFNYNWRNLTAEVAPFVVHGKETPSAAPFFRADRIRIGFKIISILERQVDIASLTVEKPQINIVVNADGSTNIPTPRTSRASKQNFAEQLLDLKIQHFELHNGFVDYNSQTIPLDLQGEGLEASVAYESSGPRYVGRLSSRQIHVSTPRLKEAVAFDLDTRLALERGQVRVLEAKLTSGESKLSGDAVIHDLASPRAECNLRLSSPMKELTKIFRLPIQPAGQVSFEGKGAFAVSPFQYQIEGRLDGRGLSVARNGVAANGIALVSRVKVTPAEILLPDLEVSALRGKFKGSAKVADFRKFSLSGAASGFSLQELGKLGKRDTGQLSGTLDGTVRLAGELSPAGPSGMTAEAKLDIVPGNGGVPVQGMIAVNYNQRAGRVEFGDSHVTLGTTSVALSGTLGEYLAVHATTRNFADALPLAPLFGETPPDKLPAALHDGMARFDGVVTGPLAKPRVSGKVDITHLALDQGEFDHIAGTIDANENLLNILALSVEQGKLRAEAHGRVGLTGWKIADSSSIAASVTLRGADIQKLLADSGSDIPASGMVSATAQITGTLESPLGNGSVDARNVTVYDEHFDRIHCDLTLSATALEVTNLEAASGTARITGGGAYNHLAKDWRNGSLKADVATRGLALAAIHHVQDYHPGLAGDVEAKGGGTAKVVKGAITLTSLNGDLLLKNVVLDGRPYGSVQLTASTRLPVLAVNAKVDLRGIQLEGSGEWRMEGDYPGQARIQIPRITFSTLHDLWPGEHLRKELPFEGYIEGEANISGSLNNPRDMKGDVTLSTVRLNAGPNVHPVAGTQIQDLVLKNDKPVIFDATTKNIDIRSASFTAKNTTLVASGRLALDSKEAWNLTAKGDIDLAILQIFNPDLLASGKSVVNMTVRGSITEPQVDGRVEVHNASVYIRDLPNGVDQANGLILFDRNRATIQNLTGITGGGSVTFESGSFVGFRGTAVVYRLQATAHQVRYRTPEGISVTANANISLIGTSESSVLSGSVVVIRAAFNPRTDVGALLATTTKPISTPSTPNEYLRGIQFDVRITSSRNLEVETSLTRNIQADANLRLRGTPDRLVILGSVTVNSGEIEFFGNKYIISRGDLNFYNPAKIEPIIDMDLETKVRGINVDITFSGPLNKLRFSYRSDPPLETNEIISLLAVGRTPAETGGLASAQSTSTSYMSTGGNALLGQAIAPATGRLQRFFGVSHIKIDPQLNDITSVPQARLTLEQQVSTDITLTYITNLARTDQQIVRVEWDFSKKWAAVALRDENGAFGIDFQYRKRFK